MKKFLFIHFIIIICAFVLNHAVTSLNLAGSNVEASYLKSCESQTVELEKSILFGLPIEVTVKGWNCAGPDSAGSGYTAQIWDHLFWISKGAVWL